MATAQSVITDQDRSTRVWRLESWHADWSGLRVAILGLGESGFAAADTLIELGAEVLVFSTEHEQQRAELLEVIGAGHVHRELASGETADIAKFSPDLVVVSPGFAPSHPLVAWALAAKVAVWGDVELAWRVRDKVVRDETGAPAEWLVVTGSADVGTTTLLAERMLLDDGQRVLACGNGTVPVLDAVRDPVGWDVLIVELSSQQLHYVDSISPLVSLCLEAGESLEVVAERAIWHGGEEAFRDALGTVFENSRFACVYNRADAHTMKMVERANVVDGCRAVGLGFDVPGPSDFGIVDGVLCDRAFLDERLTTALELATLNELAERGVTTPREVRHVLAASALARGWGVPADTVHDTLVGRAG